MELSLILLIVLGSAAFAGLAVLFGVDSRDGSDDPHRSEYPVAIS